MEAVDVKNKEEVNIKVVKKEIIIEDIEDVVC